MQNELNVFPIENVEILRRFLTDQKNRGNSPATINFYRENITLFLRWYSGDLSSVSINDVFSYLEFLRQKGNASTSIATRYRALRAFFNWYNPAIFSGSHIPKSRKSVIRVLSSDEITRLLGVLSGRDKLLVMLYLDTGLRLSEALRLRRCDVFSSYIIVLGKGDKERVVPLSSEFAKVFNIFSDCSSDLVFNMSKNAVKLLFARLKKRADIPRLHCHLLRHTFATMYLVNGGDPITLQAILGHESLDITKRYIHLAETFKLKAGNKYSPLCMVDDQGLEPWTP